MALQPRDLRQPQGQIEPSHFDGIELNIYLDGWIKQARAKTDAEDAQAAYAYHLAYQWKANQFAERPSQEDVDGVASVSYDADQRQHWEALASREYANFERLEDGPGGRTAPRSQTVSTTTSWV